MSEKKLVLTLVRGLPGSGKSHLAYTMSLYDEAYWVEADMWMHEKGEYKFDRAKLADAHAACFSSAENALSQGSSVVVSNTFVKMWEMRPYISLAKRHGALLNVIECKGNFGNIHGCPEETVQRMKENWEDYDEQRERAIPEAS